jgi:hypothetical protein
VISELSKAQSTFPKTNNDKVMWLINTNNLELKQVISEQHHRYAIVSHRWAKNLDDEVSFQDFQSIE